MFKKPQITKVVANMELLKIYMRAVKKFGKTTAFRDIILEKYSGDPSKGLLIGIGNEMGYALLDNLNATQVESWEDLEELKDWLIAEKGKEHDVKMIAFDTVDELMPLAEKEIMRLSTKEKGEKCKSFNAAFSGYGEPRKRLKLLIHEFFSDLYKAGFGLFVIGHTKVKSIKEQGSSDEGYQQLSSNLSNDYESLFGDIFDCVVTGTIERDVTDGKLSGSTRKLYLRGNGFIDAGCRFADGAVPEFIEFNEANNAKNLIDILEEGMKKSRTNQITQKEFEKEQKKEAEKIEKKAEEFIEEKTSIDVDKNNELIDKIKAKLKSIDVKEMKKVMKEYNFESFGEPETIKTEALEKIVALIK